MPHTGSRPTFLLVHGAYQRAACWALVQDELAANGWQSQAIDMPSEGEQRNSTAGLYDDAEDLAARLRLMGACHPREYALLTTAEMVRSKVGDHSQGHAGA